MRDIILITALLGAVGCATPAGEAPPATTSAQAQTAELPDFALSTTEGETWRLSEHVGKDVIVLSFWATWCAPCLSELPHLSELYLAEKDKGLVIAAISMDEPSSISEVAPTAARLGLQLPVLLDPDQRATRLYNPSRDAPMTVVINRQGEVVQSAAGYEVGDEDKLAAKLQALLSR